MLAFMLGAFFLERQFKSLDKHHYQSLQVIIKPSIKSTAFSESPATVITIESLSAGTR